MATHFEINDGFIAEQNSKAQAWLDDDYEHLGKQLRRRGVDIEDLTSRAQSFQVAVPSWGVGTGGTRFARFPGVGEPRGIYEKLEDCAAIFQLVRATPTVSLHIPWDKPQDAAELRAFASARGLHFDAMNSNTFQD
ncbi:MAG: sugar isomerase, partial [Blastocatellia bacterium]